MTATFTRFLELPIELQILIWEYAIKNRMKLPRPTNWASITNPKFGVDIYYTRRAIKYIWYKGITIQGKESGLRVPMFRKIMGVSRHARLVSLEWWKYVLKACVVEYDWEEESQEEDLLALDCLVEDLRGKLA